MLLAPLFGDDSLEDKFHHCESVAVSYTYKAALLYHGTTAFKFYVNVCLVVQSNKQRMMHHMIIDDL